MGLPSQVPDAFTAGNQSNSYWAGSIKGSSFNNVDVFKPSASNPDIQLSYTSFVRAARGSLCSCGYYDTTELVFLAFGSPTPSSGVPPTGNATYDARVYGSTTDFAASIGGDATLQFDFGAGTLAGHFDPTLNPAGVTPTNLGSYNFVNTVYGVGRTSFSGKLSISGTSNLGAFEGQFTGPVAQELMTRWTAPYLNPSTNQWSDMFGVWVGKKH